MFFGCSVYRARQGKSRFIIEKAFGFQVLWIIATLTFAWMNSAAAATVNADEASVREGRIRAATVFYLSRFVEWPSTAVAAKDSGIRVCLRGNDNSTMFFAATFEVKALVLNH
jgi:hypothetical protein